jgi:hypothetical protein
MCTNRLSIVGVGQSLTQKWWHSSQHTAVGLRPDGGIKSGLTVLAGSPPANWTAAWSALSTWHGMEVITHSYSTPRSPASTNGKGSPRRLSAMPPCTPRRPGASGCTWTSKSTSLRSISMRAAFGLPQPDSSTCPPMNTIGNLRIRGRLSAGESRPESVWIIDGIRLGAAWLVGPCPGLPGGTAARVAAQPRAMTYCLEDRFVSCSGFRWSSSTRIGARLE